MAKYIINVKRFDPTDPRLAEPASQPTPDEPSDFEWNVESIKAELDKLAARFRSHAN